MSPNANPRTQVEADGFIFRGFNTGQPVIMRKTGLQVNMCSFDKGITTMVIDAPGQVISFDWYYMNKFNGSMSFSDVNVVKFLKETATFCHQLQQFQQAKNQYMEDIDWCKYQMILIKHYDPAKAQDIYLRMLKC